MPSEWAGPPASDGWKALRDDPVANRALKSIYGCKAEINYPKLRTKPAVPRGNLPAKQSGIKTYMKRGTGSSAAAAVKVPKFKGRSHKPPAPIEYVTKRKPQATIEEEQQGIAMRINHYRPPNTRAVATDQEKDRLAEKFTFGGGKALPEELTNPTIPIPSVVASKQREAKRVAAVMRKRQGLPEEIEAAPATQPETEPYDMFEQLACEVEERQRYLTEIEADGLSISRDETRRIQAEINHRLGQLKLMTAS
ncbi:unnamed protein product [Chrysoparadoxa australica]